MVFGGVIGGGQRGGQTAELVAEGQAGEALLGVAGVVGLHAAGAQRVVEVEVQAVVVIGGQQLAGGPDVGVLPGHGVVSVHAHLGDLLASGAEDVVAGGLEAVDAGIAGPGGDAALGHARAVGVVEVAGHHRHAGDRRAGHSADAALAIVEIRVEAVVGHIARRVVEELTAAVLAAAVDLISHIIIRITRRGHGHLGRSARNLIRAVAEGVVIPVHLRAGIIARRRCSGQQPVEVVVGVVPCAGHGIRELVVSGNGNNAGWGSLFSISQKRDMGHLRDKYLIQES